jgi:CRISPR-associated protein Csb1
MSTATTLNAAALLADANLHRVILQATLVPVTGDRFQPAGFPEIGHVIYKAPRPDRTTADVCIVDSAASMANHLEAVCHANSFALELHEDLMGLPYVQCLTDGEGGEENSGPRRLVVTSLSEGHRLASSYFVGEKATLVVDNGEGGETFISRLTREFGLRNLGTKTHPLPSDWWRIFSTIFRYDPNSLVHGILFPSLGIKISRVLTAHHEAFGAARVGSSGVKFDKLGKTTSGQPIFAVDEETASEIRATFILDLSLLRSFGLASKGLTNPQKEFLLELAFWKIRRLLAAPFRFRSNCDLRLETLRWLGGDLSDADKPKDKVVQLSELSVDIRAAIQAVFSDQPEPVTRVYWPSADLFRPGKDTEGKPGEPAGEEDAEEGEEGEES